MNAADVAVVIFSLMGAASLMTAIVFVIAALRPCREDHTPEPVKAERYDVGPWPERPSERRRP